MLRLLLCPIGQCEHGALCTIVRPLVRFVRVLS